MRKQERNAGVCRIIDNGKAYYPPASRSLIFNLKRNALYAIARAHSVTFIPYGNGEAEMRARLWSNHPSSCEL